METDCNRTYIETSKTNINHFIRGVEYRKSFMLLLMVLERLDKNEKLELIDYYIEKIANNPKFYSEFPPAYPHI